MLRVSLVLIPVIHCHQSCLVYGDPSLEGQIWTEVDNLKYLSFIINYTTPVYDGYINRVQLYSVKAGVNIDIQVWRIIRSAATPTFLLISNQPYLTKQNGGFENTVSSNYVVLNLISLMASHYASVLPSHLRGLISVWQQID